MRNEPRDLRACAAVVSGVCVVCVCVCVVCVCVVCVRVCVSVACAVCPRAAAVWSRVAGRVGQESLSPRRSLGLGGSSSAVQRWPWRRGTWRLAGC